MRLETRVGHSPDAVPEDAVASVARQIHQDGASCVIFFCAPSYDLKRLGAAVRRAFPDVAVFGATSAGQIGADGLELGGFTAISLKSPRMRAYVALATGLADDPGGVGRRIADEVDAHRSYEWPAFALLLSDAFARAEERLATSLYMAIGEVAVIGGSATHVYAHGEFHADAAGLVLIETALPFRTFTVHHFVPTEATCVITRSDADQRFVYEIDGLPAAEGYAQLVGVDVEDLGPTVFGEHPLMMLIGEEWFVRAVAHVTPEGWLVTACGVDEGEVLTVGRPRDLVGTLAARLAEIDGVVGGLQLVIGFECVLRRLEIERNDQVAEVGAVLRRHRVFGVHTYGEQFNSVHMNQTFTGVALGGRP